MRLSELKKHLKTISEMNFLLPDGTQVPSHYHVTEVGQVTKHFVDCGGMVRNEKVVNFQLWYSDDTDHRLSSKKLMSIIAIAEEKLGLEDAEIEVEYQSDTIGKYGLGMKGGQFQLLSKMTDCLAPGKCDIPVVKKKVNFSDLIISNNTCTPGSGCC